MKSLVIGQKVEFTTVEGRCYVGTYEGEVIRGGETFIAIDSPSPKIAGWYKKLKFLR